MEMGEVGLRKDKNEICMAQQFHFYASKKKESSMSWEVRHLKIIDLDWVVCLNWTETPI